MKLIKLLLALLCVAALKAEDKKFVLVVYSKNNKAQYAKTIDSFLVQMVEHDDVILAVNTPV